MSLRRFLAQGHPRRRIRAVIPDARRMAHFQLFWDSRDPMDLRTRIALLLLDLGLVLVLAALAIRAAT